MTESIVRKAVYHFEKHNEFPSLWTAEYLLLALRALEEVGSDYNLMQAKAVIEKAILGDIGEECEGCGEDESIMVEAAHWRWPKPNWKFFAGNEPEYVPDPHPTALCEGCYQEFIEKYSETEKEWF